MKKNYLGIFSAVILVFVVTAFCFTGCSSSKDKIVIGSKNFTEQIILGEIIAQLIEKDTDLTVERKFNLGGTFICFNALTQGEIDIYPEYTGTGLTAILKKQVITDKDEAYDVVKKSFNEKYKITWLEPFGLNNTFTITMRKKQADRLNIQKISDLRRYRTKLQSGFTSEFLERPDGYNGLMEKYNFKFRLEPKELDPGLMYKAIKEKAVDIICGFATDGRIPAYNLQVLEDDKSFFPPYYAAPIIKNQTLKKHPELKDILNKLAGLITDSKMSDMNHNVDLGGVKPKDIAANFIKENNL